MTHAVTGGGYETEDYQYDLSYLDDSVIDELDRIRPEGLGNFDVLQLGARRSSEPTADGARSKPATVQESFAHGARHRLPNWIRAELVKPELGLWKTVGQSNLSSGCERRYYELVKPDLGLWKTVYVGRSVSESVRLPRTVTE